jgi:hypothetical protein
MWRNLYRYVAYSLMRPHGPDKYTLIRTIKTSIWVLNTPSGKLAVKLSLWTVSLWSPRFKCRRRRFNPLLFLIPIIPMFTPWSLYLKTNNKLELVKKFCKEILYFCTLRSRNQAYKPIQGLLENLKINSIVYQVIWVRWDVVYPKCFTARRFATNWTRYPNTRNTRRIRRQW